MSFQPAMAVIAITSSRNMNKSGEENAVPLAADLSVVDFGGVRIGHEAEAMPGALRCGRGNGNGDTPDLEEVPSKMVHCVMDTDETLYDPPPLDFN